jgi:hypothetical protein
MRHNLRYPSSRSIKLLPLLLLTIQMRHNLCYPSSHSITAAAAAAATGSTPKCLTHADGEQTINDLLAANRSGKCAADVPRNMDKDQACGRDQA